MIRLNEKDLNTVSNWDAQWKNIFEKRKGFYPGESEHRFNYFLSKIKDGDKVLDIACGLSDFLPICKKEKNIQATGLDYSDFAIRLSKEKYPDINWVTGNALQTPFNDNTFDVVTAGELIEHIEKPELAIKEMARITKVGGNIVFSTPHIKGYEYHIWVFNEDDVRKLLEPYGEVEVKRVPTHYIVASCEIEK